MPAKTIKTPSINPAISSTFNDRSFNWSVNSINLSTLPLSNVFIDLIKRSLFLKFILANFWAFFNDVFFTNANGDEIPAINDAHVLLAVSISDDEIDSFKFL